MSWFKCSDTPKGNIEVDLYYQCPVIGCTLGANSSFIMERDLVAVAHHKYLHESDRRQAREVAEKLSGRLKAETFRADKADAHSIISVSLGILTVGLAFTAAVLIPVLLVQLIVAFLGFAVFVAVVLVGHLRGRRLAAFGVWVASEQRTLAEVSAARAALRGGGFRG